MKIAAVSTLLAATALLDAGSSLAQSGWNTVKDPPSPEKATASTAKPAKPAAAPPAAETPPKGHIDANQDGSLNKNEMRRAREQAFIRMDADHDGKLTRAEVELVRDSLMGIWAARHPEIDPAKRPPPLDVDFFFKVNDGNKDGIVTLPEFLAVVDQRFQMIDLNKDGKITKEESEAFKKLQKR